MKIELCLLNRKAIKFAKFCILHDLIKTNLHISITVPEDIVIEDIHIKVGLVPPKIGSFKVYA